MDLVCLVCIFFYIHSFTDVWITSLDAMSESGSTSSQSTGSGTGRRAKRSGRQKVSSFADETPNFIEEVIPGTEPPQTIKYVRTLMLNLTVHLS